MRTSRLVTSLLFILLSFSILYSAGLTIGSGANFSLGGATLTLPGDWSNAGTFTCGSGTVIFNGASGNQTITNASGETFQNLQINKVSGEVVTEAELTVNGNLTLSSGDLNLNDHIVTLGTSALLSEAAGATVKGEYGYITTTRNINAPSADNVAGMGAILTSSTNLGSTVIRRGHGAFMGRGNTSIARYYEIIPTNNTGLNATLIFCYDESELNSRVEANLQMYRISNEFSTWNLLGGGINTTANQDTVKAIDAFDELSCWTLATSAPVLAKIKILLQGPFTGSAMATNLRTAGLIPTTSPYSDARTVTAVPQGVTDWVQVKLRSDVNSPVWSERSFFVKSDGSVVDEDGTTTELPLYGVNEDPFYILIYHRNHLAVMSASAQTLTEGEPALYDFTTGSDKYYGTNGAKELATNTWGLWAGDSDASNAINASDYTAWKTSAAAGTSGYRTEDLNLDGKVTTRDYVLWYKSNRAGAASQVP